MAKNEVNENKPKRHYFKDMKAELKKVIWPTPKQTMNNTVAVIVFTVVIAVVVFVLDLCFDSMNKYGVKPLQEKIQSSFNSNDEKTNNESSEESSSNPEANVEANGENSEAVENEQSENIDVQTETSTDSED